ncbi:MAG: CinA family protein [Clostridiales bacterium]|nr:CinA family protein [Clostridiales bacterium]
MNAALLVESLTKNRRTIALAESCTGGGRLDGAKRQTARPRSGG